MHIDYSGVVVLAIYSNGQQEWLVVHNISLTIVHIATCIATLDHGKSIFVITMFK